MKPLFKLIISLIVKIAFGALIIAIVMGLTSCKLNDKPEVPSFSTANKKEAVEVTEATEQSSESEATSSFLQAEETSSVTAETPVETTIIETSAKPSKTNKKKVATKAPAKKDVRAATKSPKKIVTKVPTKATEKETAKVPTKAPKKKPTCTPTPKPYTYCTCDAEVSCGSTAAGTFHKFTIKGLTAHKLKSGLWEITDASDEIMRAYMKKNYPEAANHYGVGKLKNKRDYRYKP